MPHTETSLDEIRDKLLDITAWDRTQNIMLLIKNLLSSHEEGVRAKIEKLRQKPHSVEKSFHCQRCFEDWELREKVLDEVLKVIATPPVEGGEGEK